MIYEKLLKFQQSGIVLEKIGANPHFGSKFVPLNEVLEKVKKPLNDLGIVIIQEPTVEGLKTRLVDSESGTEVSSVAPWVGHDNAQKLMACMTYFRRGSLVALLGLGDEDDDGNIASAPKTPSKPVQKATGVVEAQGEPFPSKPVSEEDSLSTLSYH